MRPLYDLKSIIYCIENTADGKRYIGQTLGSFAQRYHACRWWANSNNPYLKAARVKHGEGAFRITVLEHSKTLEELNRLEETYAKEYDCYAPKGYNLVQCGKNRRAHPSSVLLRSRTVVMNDPAGHDITVINIRKFCRDNGLDARAISRVLKGEHISHQGWTKQGVTEKHHRNKRRYTVFDTSGKQYDIIGLSDFCRELDLEYFAMRSMVQGKTQESQGYALSMEGFKKQRQRHRLVLSRGEEERIIENVKVDCPAMGLYPSYVYRLIAGKIPSYKGWVIKTVDKTPV